MKEISFADAIEKAITQAMTEDENIIIIGEDVHMLRANLFARFGKKRVIPTPISESAFTGAAISASMVGLKPIVEVMLIDFIGVAMSSLLNEASKIRDFSNGKFNVPIVLRASCGGGYGDAGQHEQSLWGWIAHIPGLNVVVPSTPEDAAALMLASIDCEDPVVYLEHKLLSDYWLDYMGIGGRDTVQFDVPKDGAFGLLEDRIKPIPLGKLKIIKEGKDLTIISIGVCVHRSNYVAKELEKEGYSVEVIDLRSISPLDIQGIIDSIKKTGKLIVVDEDYKAFGLSGEISAILLENNIPFKFKRVCTEKTIPFSRKFEDKILPNVERIKNAAKELLK